VREDFCDCQPEKLDPSYWQTNLKRGIQVYQIKTDDHSCKLQ
jgi:hypothetical protein